jgi:hypothetical protein
MSYFHVLQAQLAAQDRRQILAKCVASGALTPEQGAKVEAEIADHAANEQELAKAIRPGPSLQEIVRHGYFSELPKARFQR